MLLLSKKKLIQLMRLKFFFHYKLEKSSFLIIFLKFAKTIHSNKGFISYHSFRLNAAELLILYKRMIVLDPKIVNLL